MKKIVCIFTTIAMLISTVYAFAGDIELLRYESDVPFEYCTYYENDFESETKADGKFPATFKVYDNAGKTYVPAFASAAIVSKDALETDPDILGNKYILTGVAENGGDFTSGDRGRMGDAFHRQISGGVLHVEFDAAIYDDANVAGEFVHLGLAGKSGNSWFMSANCATGQLGTGVNMTGGTMQEAPLFAKGEWQHYAYEIDFDNDIVTIRTNDNECSIPMALSDTYIGITTYSGNAANMAFDNFHIYTVTALEEEDGKVLYGKHDFENYEAGTAPSGLLGSEGSATRVQEVDSNKVVSLNSPVRAMLAAPAEQGKIAVEFDALIGNSDMELGVITSDKPDDFTKNLFSLKGGKVLVNNDGYSEITKAASDEALTYDGAQWTRYRMIVNTIDNMIAFKVGDALSESVYDIICLREKIVSGITLSSDLGGVLIDNIKIFRQPNYVKSVSFEDFGGSVSADTENVSTVTDRIIVEFADKISGVDESVIGLYNDTLKDEVDFTCEPSEDGYSMYITPSDGYFVANNNFTLTIKKTVLNEWLQEMEDDHVVTFTTGSSLMRVFNMAITDKEGNPVDWLYPGAKAYLRIEYAKSGENGEINGILAYTATDDGELTDLHYENICLNEFGKKAYMKEFVLPENITFDKMSMFFWDTDTKMPLADKVSIGGNR